MSDKTSGDVLFDATPTIDGRNLTVEVPQDVEPGDGDYQVGFRITSSDGHSTLGSVPFSVASGAGEIRLQMLLPMVPRKATMQKGLRIP